MKRKGAAPAPDFSAVRGKRLLIALSGGADSVALAVMLAEARAEYELTLFAAHVDHAIRPESATDATFCRSLCERLGIPLRCVRMDVPALARRSHAGLETEARRARFCALEQCLRETDADYIALAHHMDDQAETVLMHLARGAGLEGLCGMRALAAGSRLYRPLLGWRKSELEAFLRERDIEWREDATNRVPDNPRNALRLDIIPQIERWYPGFARAASRCAEIAQLENDLLDAMTRDYLAQHSCAGPVCAWLGLDPPPHHAILRRAIRARCPEALDWERVNALEALCAQPRGKLDIGPSTFAERLGSRLYFVPKQLPPMRPVPLAFSGETAFPPLGRITATRWEGGPVRDDPRRQALNAAALEGAVLRTRRPGDRIRPLGAGDKLLSDYFIDKKVDRPLRDAILLVVVGNRIHWACGIGISQEAALKRGEGAVLLEYNANEAMYNGGNDHAE